MSDFIRVGHAIVSFVIHNFVLMVAVADPLSDLANLSMMYYIPRRGTPLGLTGLIGLDLATLGIPSRRDLVRHYYHGRLRLQSHGSCSAESAESMPSLQTIWDWSGFYLAFLCFKNCVIVQGVAQRAAMGLASSAQASAVAQLLPTLMRLTQTILETEPPPILAAAVEPPYHSRL